MRESSSKTDGYPRCAVGYYSGKSSKTESPGSEPVVEETGRVRYRDRCKTNMNTPVVFSGTEQSKITLDVCVDVSKASLSWHHLGAGAEHSAAGMIPYTNAAVMAWLEALNAAAGTRGFGAVRIICESTSGYHQRLLRPPGRAAGAAADNHWEVHR